MMDTTLYGLLDISPNDRSYINDVGQRAVWQAAEQYVAAVNDEILAALSVWVDETTSEYGRRYKLPGGGYMQERGKLSRPGQVSVKGEWDVQFPLLDFADSIVSDDVDLAYMTVADMQRALETVRTRAANTSRQLVLESLLNNASWSVVDGTGKGTLTIKPLANGDTDKYPPVHGSDNVAPENHYLVSGYAASAIDDSHNPCAIMRDDLEEHFGGPTLGGAEIVVFGPKAHTSKIEALSDFVSVNDMHIEPGASAAEVVGLPSGLPGVVKGRGDGYWYVEWQRLPTNYLLGIHLSAPRPLVRRIDDPGTGLGDGSLALIAQDEDYPFLNSIFRQRHGFGCGNRLNGVAMFLDAGPTWTTPSAFAR